MKRLFLIIFIITPYLITAQIKPQKDNAKFIEYKKGYYENSILKGIEEYDNQKKEIPLSPKKFSVDFSNKIVPNSPLQFKSVWYNNPVSQGATGTCWCFSAISFIESEIFKNTNQKVKLSEMYGVYWEYVERARYFVLQKGNCTFGEGSEANGLIRTIKLHGLLPEIEYSGKLPGQKIHNHEKMVEEMNIYLQSVKTKCEWNEEIVIETIKNILNKYMGTPPSIITVNAKEINPLEYSENILKVNPRDYFSFMSIKEKPFNQMGELVEDDNWWHGSNYYNISIEDFMKAIKNAINKGYSISLCGDVSEPGMDRDSKCAIIPTFDIPSEYIDDDSRLIRLKNGSTTDDHCIHLVGYLEKDKDAWFLIKDSGAGAFDGENPGFKYYNEDYVKLKMMNILVNKEAVKEILDKIIK
ncbi:MAG: peptidase C1 [Bacteroidetes bacterium]|nr:peptidase C1 [Bacteroidota bacterium]